jgi:hypothetical protein
MNHVQSVTTMHINPNAGHFKIILDLSITVSSQRRTVRVANTHRQSCCSLNGVEQGHSTLLVDH